MNAEHVLGKLGLTPGETRVYLALAYLGSSTIGPIIQRAGVSNSKIYQILDRLMKKGLISMQLKESTRYYQAAAPYALLEYVKQKQDELAGIEQEISEVIKSFPVADMNEESRVYKGYRAVRSGLLQEIAQIPEQGTYRFLSTGYVADKKFQQMIITVVRELRRRGIAIQGITHKQEAHTPFYQKYGYRMRFADSYFPADTTIFAHGIAILVWNSNTPMLHVIHSKAVADSYLGYFDRIWNS